MITFCNNNTCLGYTQGTPAPFENDKLCVKQKKLHA